MSSLSKSTHVLTKSINCSSPVKCFLRGGAGWLRAWGAYSHFPGCVRPRRSPTHTHTRRGSCLEIGLSSGNGLPVFRQHRGAAGRLSKTSSFESCVGYHSQVHSNTEEEKCKELSVWLWGRNSEVPIFVWSLKTSTIISYKHYLIILGWNCQKISWCGCVSEWTMRRISSAKQMRRRSMNRFI